MRPRQFQERGDAFLRRFPAKLLKLGIAERGRRTAGTERQPEQQPERQPEDRRARERIAQGWGSQQMRRDRRVSVRRGKG
jgi:hypothetical protein